MNGEDVRLDLACGLLDPRIKGAIYGPVDVRAMGKEWRQVSQHGFVLVFVAFFPEGHVGLVVFDAVDPNASFFYAR